ncbi:MAG: histone deacetylase family protein [Solirubrobacteraceae bacterium]
MAFSPVFIEHPSSLAHQTGPHPEQPSRILAIQRELEARGWLGFGRVESPVAPRSAIAAVHPESHIARIERLAAQGGGRIDFDTVMSAGSYEAALHAAGGAVALTEMLLGGDAPSGFSAHRPPGHHATAGLAMGFCLLNNVAIAARWALDQLGAKRVLILDWDVHHGNGTNDIFHESPEVLFVSVHQSPLYPGSGPAGDRGVAGGTGYTVNLPVPPGSGDEVFVGLVDHLVVALTREFDPQLVLISAGYDAHRDDPMGECQVTEQGYAAMTRSMQNVCAELGVPLGCVLEGGYALDALGRSVAATMEVLGEGERGTGPGAASAASATPLVETARARVARDWPGLA